MAYVRRASVSFGAIVPVYRGHYKLERFYRANDCIQVGGQILWTRFYQPIQCRPHGG
jgi:hypothetical protein